VSKNKKKGEGDKQRKYIKKVKKAKKYKAKK
jgi:hypothetical protein